MSSHSLLKSKTSSHRDNDDYRKENKISRNKIDIPASKSEEQIKSRSEVIQKLIREKEREKEDAQRKEKEKKEKKEQMKNSFRIPKKKPEQSVDMEQLINSLFDDKGNQCNDSQPNESEIKDKSKTDKDCSSDKKNSDNNSSAHKEKYHNSSSNHNSSDKLRDFQGQKRTSDKHSSSSHNHHHHKSQSEHVSSSSSSAKLSENKSGSSSNDVRSSSTSKDYKQKSSSDINSGSSKYRDSEHSGKSSSSGGTKNNLTHSSSSKGYNSSSSKSVKLSSSKPEKSSSSKLEVQQSSSSKPELKPSSSSKLEIQQSSSSKSELKPSSSSKPELKPSSSPAKNSSSPRSSGSQLTSSEQQPIVLSKHHLNPTVERQASSGLSEKETILARLQAIKQRTLEAIHKENSAKGRRFKGEKAHRKSKSEVKHDDKTKSVEIVRDIASSDDEDEVNNGIPSALDIMLSERNAKVEKDKISRMAKQAWERAMKKDTADSDKEVKVKKKHKTSKRDGKSTHKHSKSGSDEKKNNHKRKDQSLSPNNDFRKSSPKPKKQVLVRHSTQAAPPPMDFKAILEMAEKKQKEPLKPLAVIQKKKKEVDERPLTQEEKDRIERKRTKEYQDWLKFGGKPPSKKDDISDEDELPAQSSRNNVDKKQNIASADRHKVLTSNSKLSFNKHTPDKDRSRYQHQTTANGDSNKKLKNITVNENVLVCGPAASTDDEGSPKRPENPFDRIMNKFHKKRPASQPLSAIPSKKNRLEDSEEEEEDYDSDMDDFIDDGDDAEPDYSKEIKKMFGYDRSKYKYERDDDLSDMEADFSTVMKEEKQSARLGLMEDLEDMRREQEELKRKAMLKKRK